MLDVITEVKPRKGSDWKKVEKSFHARKGNPPMLRSAKDIRKKFQRMVKQSAEPDAPESCKRAAALDKDLILLQVGMSSLGNECAEDMDELQIEESTRLIEDQSESLSEQAGSPDSNRVAQPMLKRPRMSQQLFMTSIIESQKRTEEKDQVLLSTLTTATQALAQLLILAQQKEVLSKMG